MCGIAGCFEPAASRAEEAAALRARAARMAGTLAHRGPDDEGAFADAETGIALGFRRLAVVDLSPAGRQPMSSGSGRFTIVFNGEIYNFRDLRAQLASLGHRFRGHSDTEVLLTAVEQWGLPDALERIAGMFAFALWDARHRTLSLVRDRLGIKPLYYGWAPDGAFLFGSELKALRAHPSFAAEVDRGALALLLRVMYVPAPRTILRGVRQLPPGHVLTLPSHRESDAVLSAYWSARCMAERGQSSPFAGTAREAAEALDASLRDAIRAHMVADVPLGAFLSGGIDSTAVVAIMQAQSDAPVRTFTIGFHDPEYDEAAHARAIAEHLGTDHTELYVSPADALAVIPKLPEIYDEPFGDPSAIPTYLVSQLAREHVTVSLSGDGGDELFGGYDRYFIAKLLWRRLRFAPSGLRRAIATLIEAVPPARLSALLAPLLQLGARRQQAPLAGERLHRLAGLLGMQAPERLYLHLVSHWHEPAELVVGLDVEPEFALSDTARWHGSPALRDLRQRMMIADLEVYLPDDVLVKVDRASMAAGLEARVPLLDHRVVELAWRMPVGFHFARGRGKRLLRRVLSRYVPRALFDRPKMGFGAPIDRWLRGPLRDWAEALLDERRLKSAGYLAPDPIQRKWREHLSGARNWQYPLWDVLMFQAWAERWLSR